MRSHADEERAGQDARSHPALDEQRGATGGLPGERVQEPRRDQESGGVPQAAASAVDELLRGFDRQVEVAGDAPVVESLELVLDERAPLADGKRAHLLDQRGKRGALLHRVHRVLGREDLLAQRLDPPRARRDVVEGAVAHHGVEPRAELADLVLAEAPVGGGQRLLHHVVGVARAGDPRGIGHERRPVAADQLLERRLVSLFEHPQQPGVGLRA